jgi:hypothetical protein
LIIVQKLVVLIFVLTAGITLETGTLMMMMMMLFCYCDDEVVGLLFMMLFSVIRLMADGAGKLYY